VFWIDLGLLGMTTYRMVGALRTAFTVMEKLALSILLMLALKSLMLFFLILLGFRPFVGIQIGVDVLVLALTLLWARPEAAPSRRTPSPEGQWETVLACLLIGVLFLFSLVNAWFFPIVESDAAWYHVKALSFLHEVRFDSEWVVLQLRQYPPFIPLLFSWFIAFGIEPLRMLFPFFYLTLNIIFYCRVLEYSRSSKMAAMLTLALGTTPFIWWHGVLPFLDLCTAVFYSAGVLYWFFWMENLGVDEEKGRCRAMAFLSGLFFGLSSWTRLEFLLYGLIAIGLTLCAESYLRKEGERDRKSFLLFFFPLLFFSTLWFLSLDSFDFSISGNVKMVGFSAVFAWLVVLIFMMGRWKLKVSMLIKAGLFGAIIFIAFIVMDNSGTVPGWKKLSIALYRTIIVHGFYLFTALLAGFIFLGRLKNIPNLNKLYALFLVFYLLVHFAIFSFTIPKWDTFGEYVAATFINTGNSVNFSDTRGMISMYPILLFFIASLPSVRRGFGNV